jgi:nitroreductase
MDTITAIRTRRSIRAYEERPVRRELIEEIISDAAQAPTTPLSEPWVFVVVEGRDRIAGYGERAKAYARANRPSGPGYAWTDLPDFSVFHGAPAVIVICAPAAGTQGLEDCTRAGQNLMLSAHARGLGTCWVGAPMLWLRDPAVRNELGIPPTCAPFAAFALGHPAAEATGRPPATPRIVWTDSGGRHAIAG